MQRSFWQRVPWSLRIGVPLLVLVLSVKAVVDLMPGSATLVFRCHDDRPVPALRLTFHPDDLRFDKRVPPPQLGETTLTGGDRIAVGEPLVPGSAFVRYSGEGVGTGYAQVTIGKQTAVTLYPPGTMQGFVATMQPAWCFGYRGLPQPLPDAPVEALGGGEHGVVLAEARTGADGVFTLQGFDDSLDSLGLRVLAPGHSVCNEVAMRWRGLEPPRLGVVPTLPIRGRAALPAGLRPDDLVVIARGLPGVWTRLAADATFALDHVPPGMRPLLLIDELPDTWAQLPLTARAGDDVVLTVRPGAILEGFTVRAGTQEMMPFAEVFWMNAASGVVRMSSDSGGAWRITGIPAGEIRLFGRKGEFNSEGQPAVRTGERVFPVEEGAHLQNVLIHLQ